MKHRNSLCAYPDPVTPRASPENLAQVDYDPFYIMPASLPPAPRVFATAAHLERARQRLAAGIPVDVQCLARLVSACQLDESLPELKADRPNPDWGGPLLPLLQTAFFNALAWRLNDDARHRERALEALRCAAQASAGKTDWNGNEHNEAWAAGRAYDLLAGSGLALADNRAFRGLLKVLLKAMNKANHRSCNNHNSMQMAGRMTLAAALGDRQAIHDVFYGCKRGGRWRYGMIHLLRHDFLSDGLHWEGCAGYHMLVMMMVCECFTIMEHLGVDLWRRGWPALMQDDGFDEHRGWGPKGDKTLMAAFDGMLCQVFPNGDYSLLHDNGLGNLRGASVWWNVFGKAFEVYGEPRYAWALKHINGGVPATASGPVPKWFESKAFCVDFVRLEARDLPAGESPLMRERAISLVGRQQAGCSLFPVSGNAVLRSDPLDEQAPAAFLYWGPHWAGHRGPAALHLDLYALGQRITDAPPVGSSGYTDPRHLTWRRATLAHNTVTVDERPMFPFDFETTSIYECDHWRDTISDGVLESFQAGAGVKAVRASNDNVYRGVKLDRTVAVTREFVLDVYRVTAAQPRLLDWAIHCHGRFAALKDKATPVDLGQQPGYRHLSKARMLPPQGGWVSLPFKVDKAQACCSLWLGGAPEARVIMADDLDRGEELPYGALRSYGPQTCLLVRSRAASALFVSLWSFGAEVAGKAVRGGAGEDVTVELQVGGQVQRWCFPAHGEVVRK